MPALLALFAQTALSLPTDGGPDLIGTEENQAPTGVISVEQRSDPTVTPIPSNGDDDWVMAEMINKRDDSKAYSGLVSCFKGLQPNWPATQVTKEQGDKCIQQNHSKRQVPRDSAQPIRDQDDTLSTVCSATNTVISNFLTDGDLSKNGKVTSFGSDLCKTAINAAKDLTQPWGASFPVQAGHKKGLSIVHKNRKLQMLTTVANFAFDMAKPELSKRVQSMCEETLVDWASTCTTDLHYGAWGHQIDHVAKPLTAFWRDASDNLALMFDFSMQMP
ncbi:hypothetical protein K491DRAFT_685724 [Lophiostoma macrostomum CBS 122681]|uniref:Uncharacterized protein n=1 Tax=Lophiostoma macrostomum CBS 122681 TaxID=1314788 RepID=A0A6A6SJP1_9PLEO|nr:hypothetical protein K491DRAFT_685724 [Lophiostoma macrostomum CBS 122681]